MEIFKNNSCFSIVISCTDSFQLNDNQRLSGGVKQTNSEFVQSYNYFWRMATNKIALLKRREKDMFKLKASKYNVQLTQNQSTFQVQFCGPLGTPYQLGKWKINLYLPEDYPFKSPSVGFINRIYHPNIDFKYIFWQSSSGSVCLDVINQTWTPMYQLLNIFEIFLPQLLTYPNPASPLNQQAAHLYETNIQKFNQKVKEHINKHALNQALLQIVKKNYEVMMIEGKKTQQTIQSHKSEEEIEECHSMDQEGSSLSQKNSILDDDDLKLY